MSESETQLLRERVASGAATGQERDRLAMILARAIRDRDDAELAEIEALIDELRVLARAGSDRSSCTNTLASALLDAQIRAFERGDAADAWRRLDEIRAQLLQGGTPDLLQDRLAAALYNTIRGGELIGDQPMRLAALEELRTRAYCDPSAAACRVALAELRADELSRCGPNLDGAKRARAEYVLGELARLHTLDPGVAIAAEYARGVRELLAAEFGDAAELLERLRSLAASYEHASGDGVRVHLAGALVTAHANALRGDDEQLAETLREQLRVLATGHVERQGERQGERANRTPAPMAIVRERGKALHDAAVLELEDSEELVGQRAARALSELRVLVHHHEADTELRGQLMSALFQLHRNAIERGDEATAELLQAEADALLIKDAQLHADDPPSQAKRSGLLGPGGQQRGHIREQIRDRARDRTRQRKTQLIRAELRLDHLRMLLATHASAGDRGDVLRAELLLAHARELVQRANSPLDMLEVYGQMLVNAHVDAGAVGNLDAVPDIDRTRSLLIELDELARLYPHSAAMQLHLATALFNAHVDAGRRQSIDQADRLLGEIERIHLEHPGLLELRRRFVMAIVNHHGDALERNDLDRAWELLDRLRSLIHTPQADNHLRIQLAMALGNNLAHIENPNEDEQGQRIVSELRVLASNEAASPTLRALVLDELSELFAPRQ